MSFAAPLWLLGLAGLPAIRWLHRGGRHRQAVPVSRLGLWRGSMANDPDRAARRPPDPAWRRRALLTALIVAALAGPRWSDERPDITLWVDDSISMLTREAGGTRLALVLAQAREQLAGVAHAGVEVRALGDPWHPLGALGDTAAAALAAGAGRREPAAPPAALLQRDRQNWLLTDGAEARLFDWPDGSRPHRVIEVAGVTRNAGLTRLSARRSAGDPQQFELLAEVRNGGSTEETRRVVFTSDTGASAGSMQRIEPGKPTLVTALIPASASVRATLQPTDALAEDDELVLDLAPLRRQRVTVDPGCAPALASAVRAHPALAVTQAGATSADAVLDCGTLNPGAGLPTIRVRADRAPAALTGSLQWAASVAGSRRAGIDAQQLRVAATLQARPPDAVVLAVGDQPVLVVRAGAAKRLETSLDFEAMAGARGPEIPLLLNLMLEQLLGRPLLDAIAVSERDAAAVAVVPAPRRATAPVPLPSVEPHAQLDAVRPLLLAALTVLLWEIAALGRQWRRLTRDARAPSA